MAIFAGKEWCMKKRIYEIIEQGKRGDKYSVAYDILMLIAIIVSIIPLMDYCRFSTGKERLVLLDLSVHFLGHCRPFVHTPRPQSVVKGIQDFPNHKAVESASLV